MGKKSALPKYRVYEKDLAQLRSLRAKDDPMSAEELSLLEFMNEIWYEQLTQAERDMLSKEA